jgi:hypothetical protein
MAIYEKKNARTNTAVKSGGGGMRLVSIKDKNEKVDKNKLKPIEDRYPKVDKNKLKPIRDESSTGVNKDMLKPIKTKTKSGIKNTSRTSGRGITKYKEKKQY